MSNARRVWLVLPVILLLVGSGPGWCEEAALEKPWDPAEELNRLESENPGVRRRFESVLLSSPPEEQSVEIGRLAASDADPVLAQFASAWLRSEDPAVGLALDAYERAYERAAPAEEIQLEIGGGYKLFQREIPLSHMVASFLSFVGAGMVGHEGPLLPSYLQKLGVKAGSPDDAALIQAVLGAREAQPTEAQRETRRARLSGLVDDREAYIAANRAFFTSDAERLGEVWGRLGTAMGSPEKMGAIQSYIDTVIRPGTSLASTESFTDTDHYVWTFDRAFARGVARGSEAE